MPKHLLFTHRIGKWKAIFVYRNLLHFCGYIDNIFQKKCENKLPEISLPGFKQCIHEFLKWSDFTIRDSVALGEISILQKS